MNPTMTWLFYHLVRCPYYEIVGEGVRGTGSDTIDHTLHQTLRSTDPPDNQAAINQDENSLHNRVQAPDPVQKQYTWSWINLAFIAVHALRHKTFNSPLEFRVVFT